MSNTSTEKRKHTHIWKYLGAGYERICEAPLPTIESCGEEQMKHTDQCCGEGWETLKKGIYV